MYDRSYTEKQSADFISLIVEMVLIKDATVKTGITISTAYHFRKTWNEIQEVLEKKKRGRVKVGSTERTHIIYRKTC